MTLSSAFNYAMSGLAAASRSTTVVSDNLANSLTEGYRRRTLDLNSNSTGGVQIGSVIRTIDPALQKSSRAAEATYSASSVTATFYERVSDKIGTVNDDYSLAQRMTDFEAALVEATSLPDSDARLNNLAMEAEELALTIRQTATQVSDLRNASEQSIASQVEGLQRNLVNLDRTNNQILAARISGQDTSGLEDQRDQLINAINSVIPVQIYNRDNDQVALYTKGGTMLLDGVIAEIEFDERSMVTPYMSTGNGQLSGLTIDGKAINTSINGPIGGGTLAAEFYVRDVASVEAQADLDAMAGDLILRFQDPSVDPTLGATDIGLYTDGGFFYDPANQLGIANRIEINSVVAVGGAGETWRLRDGLNAATQGPKGDTTILNNYVDALQATNTLSSPGLGTGDYNAYTVASSLMTHFTQQNTWAQQELAFSSAMYSDYQTRELEMGVDTDAELQSLMVIETVYGANARMLQAIDDMMQELLSL